MSIMSEGDKCNEESKRKKSEKVTLRKWPIGSDLSKVRDKSCTVWGKNVQEERKPVWRP